MQQSSSSSFVGKTYMAQPNATPAAGRSKLSVPATPRASVKERNSLQDGASVQSSGMESYNAEKEPIKVNDELSDSHDCS